MIASQTLFSNPTIAKQSAAGLKTFYLLFNSKQETVHNIGCNALGRR